MSTCVFVGTLFLRAAKNRPLSFVYCSVFLSLVLSLARARARAFSLARSLTRSRVLALSQARAP